MYTGKIDALVPDIINNNEVEMQSIRYPSPVPFLPTNSELPEAQGDEYTVNVRINYETEERVSVFHSGILKSYLQCWKLCESLVHKKDLYTTCDGYEKEEYNTINNLH